MANYKSAYTGAEIDAGIGKANTAVQDVSDYVKKTDYATSSVGGVLKVSNGDYGLTVDSGVLKGTVRTYTQYNDMSSTGLVCKGTLENVIEGKDLATMDDVKGLDVTWVRNQNGTVADYNALYNYLEQGNTNVYWNADGYTYISDSMSIDVSEGVKYINLNFNTYTYEISLDGSTIEYNYYPVQFENFNNKVTSINSFSTDTQYPSAKCVYDMIGDVETILTTLTIGSGV